VSAEMDTPSSGIYVPNLKWGVFTQPTSNGVSTMKNRLIGIYLAKNVFQIGVMDDHQKIILIRKCLAKN
jgi:hypothetical protein